jgi:hypothetical protein
MTAMMRGWIHKIDFYPTHGSKVMPLPFKLYRRFSFLLTKKSFCTLAIKALLTGRIDEIAKT